MDVLELFPLLVLLLAQALFLLPGLLASYVANAH
jgi:hypothetical protein